MTSRAKLIELMMTVPEERHQAIIAAATGTPDRPRPGTIRQAAEIGCCDPRTIARYAQRGLLTPIRITPRRVRYDLSQVERLFTQGAAAMKTTQAERLAPGRVGVA